MAVNISISKRTLTLAVIVVVVAVLIVSLPIIPTDSPYNEVEPYERLATYRVVSSRVSIIWTSGSGSTVKNYSSDNSYQEQ
jgi:hypothetical protein